METTIQQALAMEANERFKIDVRKPSRLGIEREVLHTPQEIRELVGDELSVKVNFVPQMLTALVMDLATEFVNHRRDNRISEVKKHTRLMREAVEKYSEDLFRYYGKEATASYVEYVKRFKTQIETDVWLLRLKLREMVANQMPHVKDRQVPILACAICGVIAYVEWYDSYMDKALAERLGRCVSCRKNRCLTVIKALCADITLVLGCRIDVDGDRDIAEWLTILGNRATFLAEKILVEESENKS